MMAMGDGMMGSRATGCDDDDDDDGDDNNDGVTTTTTRTTTMAMARLATGYEDDGEDNVGS